MEICFICKTEIDRTIGRSNLFVTYKENGEELLSCCKNPDCIDRWNRIIVLPEN